jgi:cation-transporting ATPase F
VARQLGTSPDGLSLEEARRRLHQFGANEIEGIKPISIPALILHQFASPLIYILLAAAVVTLLLGEYIDTAVIAAVLALNATIGFIQEYRAEKSVRALMQLTAPHARVIRDGKEYDIESRELAPGDVVLLESGVRVPADIRLFQATALQVDESMLTGESVAVYKQVAPIPETRRWAIGRTWSFRARLWCRGAGAAMWSPQARTPSWAKSRAACASSA